MSKRLRRYEDEGNGNGNGGNGGNGKGSGNSLFQQLRFQDQVVVSAKTEGQRRYIQEIKANSIIFCVGPAGSGKTAIAVGLALQEILSSSPAFKRIVLMRPVKEACEEHVGYLPGSLDEKMAPWAAPLVDNMEVFDSTAQIRTLFANKMVETLPLAYARGRSLNETFAILDEAQNCTPEQMLMALTRIGHNSKLVINGDLGQSDLWRRPSGLADAIQRLQGMAGVAVVELTAADIVRNPMISEILRRYAPQAEVPVADYATAAKG